MAATSLSNGTLEQTKSLNCDLYRKGIYDIIPPAKAKTGGKNQMEISVPKAGSIRISDDGFHVLLTDETGKTLIIPWNAALEVAKEMKAKALKIGETAHADKLINDQALLIRLSVPLGLTDNPDIKKEALKEAQWNSELRRYIPSVKGIPSGEVMGAPKIIQHPPKGGNNGRKDL